MSSISETIAKKWELNIEYLKPLTPVQEEDLDEQVVIYSTESTAKAILHEKSVELSETLNKCLEETPDTTSIPIGYIEDVNQTNELFELVCKWLDHHRVHQADHLDFRKKHFETMSEWDTQFFKDLDMEIFADFVNLANYLGIKDLIVLCCRHIYNQLKGKTREELTEYFGPIPESEPDSMDTSDD